MALQSFELNMLIKTVDLLLIKLTYNWLLSCPIPVKTVLCNNILHFVITYDSKNFNFKKGNRDQK